MICLFCYASILLGQAPESGSSRSAIAAIVADRHVADSALEIHRRAMAMSAEDRFRFLVDRVLPADSNNTFRVTLDFTPTHPAPPVVERDANDTLRIELAKRRGEKRVQTGGNLVSPAQDLIAVAMELGQLGEIRKRVEAAAARGNAQQRARLSLLAVIDIANGDFDAALRSLDALFPLIEANMEHNLVARAPELLAIHAASAHAQTRGFARDAVANLIVRAVRVSNHGPAAPWESQLMAMMAAIRICDGHDSEGSKPENLAAELSNEPRLAEWNSASRWTASSRGPGHSRSHWLRVGDRVENIISHKDDFLYYHVPLQGNFQVECELQNRDYQQTQLVVGGQWAEPLFYTRSKYEFGDFRERLGRGNVEPMLTKYYNSAHLRISVQDKVITYYVNGRLLHRVEVRGEVDPWIALRSEDRYDGGATNIRITGNPVIPAELRLTAADDLAGWYPYFPGQVGKPKATWQQLGDIEHGGGIVAPRRTDVSGMHVERLLRYHRPMFEDGTIEYEFFYREGATHVHPAVDRLAFLLEPNGVRIHWVTDGEFDRTELMPGNVFDEPAQRRGPAKLPFVIDDWNRLRLTLEGDTVSLYLNEQIIYQRELEITNQRTFGIFHYSDRTEARVRNVRWRGNWPRELAPVAKQELASHTTQFLDERLPALTAVFEHNFAKDGFPSEKFTVPATPGGTVTHVEDGVRVDRPGGQGYMATSLAVNAIPAGDFDVIADFQQLDARPSADAISTVGIKVFTNELNAQQCLVMRRFVRDSKQEDKQLVQAVFRNGATEPTLDWKTLYGDALESDSGKLRIARRGNRVYYLVAEGDSPNFRLIAESDAATGSLPRQAVQILTQSSGQGSVSVLWKNIVIRAEKLTYVPSANTPLERTVSVMNHDGTGLRRLLPKDSGLDGPGSPAWSPDGKLVAFDVYNGSTTNSHIYVINADGSNLRDLGIGNMPTFSPSGKQLAFSWGGNGIATMNVDGSKREVLDTNGWGAQWSPDGRIAYARGGNIVVNDLKKKTQREILEGEQAARYANVYWNFGWSRDGQRVCFKARTHQNQYEVAVAAVAGSRQEFQILYAKVTYADFSWHPDGNRILICMQMNGGPRLFTLDRKKPGPPVIFNPQPLNHYVTGADWSSDGKQIVFSSQVLPDSNNR